MVVCSRRLITCATLGCLSGYLGAKVPLSFANDAGLPVISDIHLSLAHPLDVANQDFHLIISAPKDTKSLAICLVDGEATCKPGDPTYFATKLFYATKDRRFFKSQSSALLSDGLTLRFNAFDQNGKMVDTRTIIFNDKDTVNPAPQEPSEPSPNTAQPPPATPEPPAAVEPPPAMPEPPPPGAGGPVVVQFRNGICVQGRGVCVLTKMEQGTITLTNEKGMVTTATVQGDKIKAAGWNVTGTVIMAGEEIQSILWNNNTEWHR